MIGIIGAMDTEVIGYLNAMTDKVTEKISGYSFTCGKLNGTQCVAVMCGIGKVNAAVCAQTMILRYKPDYIINSGIGGGLTEKTDIGDIIIASGVIQHDVDTTAFGDPRGLLDLPSGNEVLLGCSEKLIDESKKACERLGFAYHVGTVVTGDQFISETEKRATLHNEFNAVACEMEGGSIGQTCRRSDIPFIIIRVVSDNTVKSNHMDYLEFKKQCSEKSIKLVTSLLQTL